MPTSGNPLPDSTGHYARLADSYDTLWDRNPQFKQWMVGQMLEIAAPRSAPIVADVGAGTGIFAVEMLRQLGDQAMVYLIDPSREMLSHAPTHPRLQTLCAPAEHTRAQLAVGGVERVDLLLIKEAVHHFRDPAATLHDLSHLVGPGQTLLVVMLPTHIDYPLFGAALQRFSELQPDPADITSYLSDAGLVATRQTRGFDVDLPKIRWLELVANRFMSLLSTFTDAELAGGVHEIEEILAGADRVHFRDNFEFVLGRRPANQ